MLCCMEDITIYHKTYDETTRMESNHPTVLHGCSWFVKQQSSVTENGMQVENMYMVRIPLKNAPNELIFTKGDYVLKGEVLIENATVKDLLKYTDNVFLIKSFSVNDKGSPYTQHIRISGS